MRLLSIDTRPIDSARNANAGKVGLEPREPPVLTARVGRLPTGVAAFPVTGDIEGREHDGAQWAGARLVGEVLPVELGPTLAAAAVPPLSKTKPILPGNIYTVCSTAPSSPIGAILFGGRFSAMGTPKRFPNAYDHGACISMVVKVLAACPRAFVLHDGPDSGWAARK